MRAAGRKALWVAGVALSVLCFCMLLPRVEGASAMSRHVAAARLQDEGKGEQQENTMVGGMFLSSMTLPKQLFQRCFESAEHSITAAVYKFGDKDLYESLLGAIKRSPGLKVRIVANDKTISKKHRGWLEKLEEEGSDVEVRLWKKHGDHFNKLHAKFTVCDTITVSGSPNWSDSSNEGDNMEIVEVSTDQETAQKMENLFEMLWSDKHANRL
jgi:phosphatidylserine/phosphatidylglycerophosphate/cardiolipin synthase-like enzyme